MFKLFEKQTNSPVSEAMIETVEELKKQKEGLSKEITQLNLDKGETKKNYPEGSGHDRIREEKLTQLDDQLEIARKRFSALENKIEKLQIQIRLVLQFGSLDEYARLLTEATENVGTAAKNIDAVLAKIPVEKYDTAFKELMELATHAPWGNSMMRSVPGASLQNAIYHHCNTDSFNLKILYNNGNFYSGNEEMLKAAENFANSLRQSAAEEPEETVSTANS